jgi:hypothetical protein
MELEVSEHSFRINLDEEYIKPLPCNMRRAKSKTPRIKIPDEYPKYEVEFYEVVADCAKYIDKIQDTELRLKMHKDLSKIFVLRHRVSAMRLFRELVNNI